MSITARPPQSQPSDVALAAITQALGQMGHVDQQAARLDEVVKLESEKNTKLNPSDQESRTTEPNQRSSRGRQVSPSKMNLLALACIGVVAFAWLSTRDNTVSQPISTGSISIEKKELPARAMSSTGAKTDAANMDAGLPQQSSSAQTTPQRAVPEAPTATDPVQSIQPTARQVVNLEQLIEQIRDGQARMVHDNAKLAADLKVTEEMARHSSDSAEDLKAVQAQMARDNLKFAEELKASQERMANLAEQLKTSREEMARIAEQLKASQEQLARIVASERKQRPRALASSPTPPIANLARKPAPTAPSPPARVQPADPARLQPKQ